jgi:sugar-phosphatase
MKLLLFGKIGSGKSFIGELLQREFGIAYHDADLDLPDTMREAIRNHEPISEKMRDSFVEGIIERIHQLSRKHDEFCIAQALFKEHHRQRLLEAFPDLTLVWVHSTDELTDTRLQGRTGHLASRYYAQMVNPQFEVPTHTHQTIENTADITQLRKRVVSMLESARSDRALPVFKALLFDLDGTLVDSNAIALKVMEVWCAKHGIPFQAVLEVGHGGRTEDAVARLAPHLDAEAEAAEIEHLEATSLDGLAVTADADCFVNSVARYAWAIVTSSSLPLATSKLAACHLPVPDVLLTAECVQHGKPHPEPFLKAAEALGVTPEECLVFEDADNGVNSALAAGCKVIIIGDGCAIQHHSVVVRLPSFVGLTVSGDGKLQYQGETIAQLLQAQP